MLKMQRTDLKMGWAVFGMRRLQIKLIDMPKYFSKIFLILFFLLFLVFPLGKISAVLEDCIERCSGDSDCSSYPDAICTSDHGYSGIPKMCCHAPCRPDTPTDCPAESFFASDGGEYQRYCIEGEWRCARNGDPPPPALTVGDCTTDADCRSAFPDRPYCLLRPGHIEGNVCVRCKEDSQCPPGQYCTSGNSCQVRSERNCCYDSDCPGANEICWSETTSLCTLGHCCKTSDGCMSDADCQGRRCISGVPSHCEKSSLPPAAGSVAEGGRCAKASECSGRFGCLPSGASCEGTCGICTTNEDCLGKGAGQCRPDESGAGMCGAEAGVTCVTNDDCERIHGLPGFECRGGICEPPTTPTPPTPAAPYVYEVTQPELQIPLPTLAGLTKFLSATLVGETGDRYLIIPWLAEYIAALYKYAIGIVGILSGIMIVIGGLLWLTAGGAADKISTAKSFIESSLVGLVIALTSYLLLYAINPNLVSFESLKVKFVERVGEEPVVLNFTSGQLTTQRETAQTAEATPSTEEVSSGSGCTVLFLTDSQGLPQCFTSTVNSMLAEQNVDIVIHGGDIAEAPDLWRSWWDTPSAPLTTKWPVYAVTGNHDRDAGVDKFAERFATSFPLPKKITCGNTDLFLLPFPGTNDVWLKQNIPESTAKWQVIVTHRPMYYSCTGSGSITGKNKVPLESIEGVDLVLSGHEHVYCDGEQDGRRYIISNTAGSKFRRCKEPKLSVCNDEIEQSYLRIEFGNTINVQRKTMSPPPDCRTYYAGS